MTDLYRRAHPCHGRQASVPSRMPLAAAVTAGVLSGLGIAALPPTVAAQAPDPCIVQRGEDAPPPLPFRVLIDGQLRGTEARASRASRGNNAPRCDAGLLERADLQIRLDEWDPLPTLNVEGPRTASHGEEVWFRADANYGAYLARKELRILRAGGPPGAAPLALASPAQSDSGVFRWTVSLDEGTHEVLYVLRVYDRQGRFDETEPQILSLVRPPVSEAAPEPSERHARVAHGGNRRAIVNIPVRGGAVIVSGKALTADAQVTILGRAVDVAPDGRFVAREILPPGEHIVHVLIEEADGASAELRRTVSVRAPGWFYLGVADLSVGRNEVTGPAPLWNGIDSHRYKGDTFHDGRLAFYLRGNLGTRTVFTASADSREGPIDEIFSNLTARDPLSLLRRLDANVAYPIYGDDGVLVEDAPTQGRFFARLERDDSHLMWGSFQTPVQGTDLVRFQRGLYGAQLIHRGRASTGFGERRNETVLFAADPHTVGSREEFRATGGSLFYLRRQDILLGSERVFAEVRDRDSGLVLSSTPLMPFDDYELNALQGRLVLRTPLASVASAQSLVRDGALHGNPVFLVVTYEYSPNDLGSDRLSAGGRTSHWLGDHLQVGITGYRQEDGAWDQQLVGGDVALRLRPGTYLRAEHAQSEGRGSPVLASLDGGLSFQPLETSAQAGASAMATRVEFAADFSREGRARSGALLRGYWEDREDGFAAPGMLAPEGVRLAGGMASLPMGRRFSLEGKADAREGDRSGRHYGAEVGADLELFRSVKLQSRVRQDHRSSSIMAGASEILSEVGARTDVIVLLGYQPVDTVGTPGWYRLYGLTQSTVASDEDRRSNSLAGLGAELRLTARLSMASEVTYGDGGWGGKAETDLRVSERTSLYLRYLLDADQRGLATDPQRGLTTGGRFRYSEATSVFAEHRQETSAWGGSNLLRAFGVDIAPSEHWTWTLQMERGVVADPSAGDVTRSGASIYGAYGSAAFRWKGGVEYRTDDASQWGERTTWLGRSTVALQLGRGWRALGRANLALTEDAESAGIQADYREFVAGLAYRPVSHGRASVLVRYTLLHDLASPAQLGPRQDLNPLAQRSQVVALDGTVRLLPRLALGGKLGLRTGEIRDRGVDDAAWIASTAWLAIARTDLQLSRSFGVLGEARFLEATEALDARAGALLTAYQQLGDHLRVGLGYNFTDYSDDLTDLSFRSQGWFLNFLGSF